MISEYFVRSVDTLPFHFILFGLTYLNHRSNPRVKHLRRFPKLLAIASLLVNTICLPFPSYNLSTIGTIPAIKHHLKTTVCTVNRRIIKTKTLKDIFNFSRVRAL